MWSNLSELSVNHQKLANNLAICRLCLLNDGPSMQPIFHSAIESCIADKIASVTRLTLSEGDGLPALVCQQCISQLDVAGTFIQRCTSSDWALRCMYAQEREPLTTNPLPASSTVGMGKKKTSQTVAGEHEESVLISKQNIKTEVLEPANFELQDFQESAGPKCVHAVYIPISAEEGADDNITIKMEVSSPIEFEFEVQNEDIYNRSESAAELSQGDQPASEDECYESQPVAETDKKSVCSADNRSKLFVGEKITEACHEPKVAQNVPSRLPPAAFVCGLCNCEYGSVAALKAHTVEKCVSQALPARSATYQRIKLPRPTKTSGSAKFVCRECDKEFADIGTLEIHKTTHTEGKAQSSKICWANPGSKISDLQDNFLAHRKQNDKFPCDSCPKVFATSISLRGHKLSSHGTVNKSHLCTLCQKGFSSKNALIMHVPWHSKKQSSRCRQYDKTCKDSGSLPALKLSQAVIKNLRYKCTKCNQHFADQESLANHVGMHSTDKKHKCQLCQKSFQQKILLKNHMLVHQERQPFKSAQRGSNVMPKGKIHKCKLCEKSFRRRVLLKSHMRVHEKRQLFKCAICGKDLMTKASLICHVSRHVTDKIHKCQLCEKSFNQSVQLKSHMLVHKMGMFKCAECDKNFKSKPSLKYHVRTHCTQKRHKCEVCNKIFNQRVLLKNHMLVHGKEVFNCADCNKGFERKKSLVYHVRIHSTYRIYRCELCEKSFNLSNLLKRHRRLEHKKQRLPKFTEIDEDFYPENLKYVRVHGTGKKHICGVCKKSFNQKILLKNHMLIHEELRPWKCADCLKAYMWEKHLVVHIKRCHTLKEGQRLTTKPFPAGSNIGAGNKKTSQTVAGKRDEIASISEHYIKTDILNGATNFEVQDFQKSAEPECANAVYIPDSYVEEGADDNITITMEVSSSIKFKEEVLGKDVYKRLETATEASYEDKPASEDKYNELQPFSEVHGRFVCSTVHSSKLCFGEGIIEGCHQPRAAQNEPSMLTPATFVCKLCNHEFDSTDTLRTHIEEKCYTKGLRARAAQYEQIKPPTSTKNQGNAMFACRVCDKEFAHIDTLEIHKATHKDTDGKAQVSTICVAKPGYKISDLQDNFLAHSEQNDKFPCDSCPKVFATSISLRGHKLGGHGTIKKRHFCTMCPQSFPSRIELIKHVSLHSKKQSFQCGHYVKTCKDSGPLPASFTSHHRITDLPYKCTKYNQDFVDQESLSNHEGTHSTDKKHKCVLCQKNFQQKILLKNHMLVHRKRPMFKCTECGRDLKSKASLIYHVQTHVTDKIYKCGKCEKSFSQRVLLKSHMRVHEKRQLFKCAECDKNYLSKQGLKNHVRTCCTQEEHKCEVCQKTFKQRVLLQNHMLVHGKEVFNCAVCHRGFERKKSLMYHVLSHATYRIYRCELCEKSFNLTDHLKRHMRLVHKKRRLPKFTESGGDFDPNLV